ncbi:hypothetical protein SCHPADRAFT_657824 [Schizopora paradoxa]|uniref:NACHT domain-containing protein n=1 Tax=Schizopora paradoxa TaxID=27342 RepID=A0A0H2RQZ2_9AGAM|nr:hypothetical protein SCHPADRAFT_657824 [Schizopora paradoxa]
MIGDIHPLAKAVVTAMMVPYHLLKNAGEYAEKMKDLAKAMYFACECLMEVRHRTRIGLARDLFMKILRLLRNASIFIDIYCKKGRIRQLIGAQFPTKLDKFAEDIIKCKNDFQIAMVLQIAGETDGMSSMTSDYFLRSRLNPVDQQRLDSVCLEGTRTKILDDVQTWLRDAESKENILWVVGVPGAGKSTIATTIADALISDGRPCATFFAKRDMEDLRDPRRIWPSLAYSLSDRHEGVKAALMLALGEKHVGDVRDDSAIDQFQKLIREPLETDLKETRLRPCDKTYPVVIIDAIDECNSDNFDVWKSLLNSLACWSNLSSVFKLIVTSRPLDDVQKKLGGLSYRIGLDTGHDVSDDSETSRDVRKFFEDKFSERDWLPRGWPGELALEEITRLSAGLFIWADMVVHFVAPQRGAGGSDPDERLKTVLRDSRCGPYVYQVNKVDLLYARILFEAFHDSTFDEREKGKVILASVVLAKEPLRKNDLVEFLSPISLYSIESTLRALSPVIPAGISDDANERLRVCHKTVADFVLSYQRGLAAFRHLKLIPDGPDQDLELHSYLMDSMEEEHRRLAFMCVHYVHQHLPPDIPTVLKNLTQAKTGFMDYAVLHWIEHVEDAGLGCWAQILPNLTSLASAMRISFRCLTRYAGEKMVGIDSAFALIQHLLGAVEESILTINGVHQGDPDFPQRLDECTKGLDMVRGNVQIAMILKEFPDIDDSAANAADTFLRRQLKPSDQSELDEQCVPGTRTSVLSEAKAWLENTSAPNVLWVVGAPGAGKSAFATTLVKREFPKICLCAKVFAKRDFADRRDPTLLWRTLAYDLANLHTGIKGSIMESLFSKGLSDSKNQGEFLSLIINAIEEQHCLPVVAVIDALDECFTEDKDHWRTLLQIIASFANLFRSLKLVVTSRDLPDIRRALSKIRSHSIRLKTGKEIPPEATLDLEKFFRSERVGLPSSWLEDNVIWQLAECASGSYIWAKMVVGLIKLKPDGRLEDILKGHTGRSTERVDILYGKLLVEILGQLPVEERNAFRAILAAIVLAKSPLQQNLLELLPSNDSFGSNTREFVENAIHELSPIIALDENGRVRIPHKSFSDFFVDPIRTHKAMAHFNLPIRVQLSFLMDRDEDSGNLSMACLRLMATSLSFNPYGIPTSHILNDKIDLRVLDSMDPALTYACRYWGEHLQDAPRMPNFRERVRPLLDILLREKVLYWMENLSLANAIPSAKKSLLLTARILEGHDDELVKMTNDVRGFLGLFERPIAAAASHIYISALPFCPSKSRLRQVYGPRFANLLSVTTDQRSFCCDSRRRKETEFGDTSSPDGFEFASESLDKTSRIWDSMNDKRLALLYAQTSSESVYSAAISPNGKLIASGDIKGVLRIWDNETGISILGQIQAHNDIISALAFSPDSARIVTGSWDYSIKIWNALTGKLSLGPLMHHSSFVVSVAFSPDGFLIASGSLDKTIWIWDIKAEKPLREPLATNAVYSGLFHCLAFSADGQYLASSSFDKSISLWNVAQGFTQIFTMAVRKKAYSVCFSPDSKHLVSGHEDGSLIFWNVDDGRLHRSSEALFIHAKAVRSVMFSFDGLYVVSRSEDKSVKVSISSVSPTGTFAQFQVDSETTIALENSLAVHKRRCPSLSDESYIDHDGWLRDSRRSDARVLLWVPEEHRGGIRWPRNTSVVHRTTFDFSRFVHGEKWEECAKV